MQLLDGKTAVVTGGGRGIGRGITDKLLAAGAHVLIAQRKPLEPELAEQARVSFVAADLSKREATATIAQAAQQQLGGVDILVNNAGIMFEQTVEEMTEDAWDQMMAINLRAPVFLAKALLPLMRSRGGGSIINIGSIEGLGANSFHSAYCASKGGVHGLTKAMAVDLGVDGIRCNALAPGWIESDLSRIYLNAQADPEGARKALVDMHPIKRTGQPQDIGDAAVFLASDMAGFMTGEVLVVDGGRTAKLPMPF